jgi:hypothetical protein
MTPVCCSIDPLKSWIRVVRRLLLFGAGIGLSIVMAIEATGTVQSTDVAPRSGRRISIVTVAVPLNPQNPSETAVGDFDYAGGIVLASRETDQLHGLSDLEVSPSNRLAAVSDLGSLLEATLTLDGSGRLAGLADATVTPMAGEDGQPLIDKANADAEGLAILPSGDRLVSFERHDRIWLYPRAGGPPKPAPMPDATFPLNGGMEALAADAERGADAYVVGAEISGETWTCKLAFRRCTKGSAVVKPAEFGLVAIRQLPGMRSAYLLRAFDEQRGSRISLRVVRGTDVISRMDLARPITVDNFEGLAVVRQDDGRFRFYLCSDDNASASQRTILMAFDWRPR